MSTDDGGRECEGGNTGYDGRIDGLLLLRKRAFEGETLVALTGRDGEDEEALTGRDDDGEETANYRLRIRVHLILTSSE